MYSPTISAPPGLDIAKIGEAYLQLFGMSTEEAARFSQRVDWATTLVVPIPYNGTTYHDVVVDGVDGTLVQFDLPNHQKEYVLMWVNNDIVYALSGPGTAADATPIVESLE